MDPPRDSAHRRHPDASLRCSFSFGQIDPPETIRECSLERAMAVHRDYGNREDLHQEARVATSTAAASVRFLTPRTSIALDQLAIALWWEAAITRILAIPGRKP
jgi:hypothetical protein